MANSSRTAQSARNDRQEAAEQDHEARDEPHLERSQARLPAKACDESEEGSVHRVYAGHGHRSKGLAGGNGPSGDCRMVTRTQATNTMYVCM